MKKNFLFVFLIILFATSLTCQNWSISYTPKYRKNMQIKTLSMEKISILGGWPQNDSITFMAYTEDNGNSWEINDLFPGKMLNTGLYYNSGKVIAAGLNGAWYKSYNFGKNWETSSAGIDLNHKNVNSLKQGMGDRALGCGGLNGTNGFIIMSNDNGENWSFLQDNFENEITDISISGYSNDKLVICGYNNTLKYSDNGGASWINVSPQNLSVNAKLNALDIFDGIHGICVGGKEGLDSTQIILITNNGGHSWTLISENPGPALNDIDMINESIAYAVGDDGTIIMTSDGGLTWNEVIIPNNPLIDLYSVDFINIHFGRISGNNGVMVTFIDGTTITPQAITLDAKDVTNKSALLRANINPGFTPSLVSFQYGQTQELEETIPLGTYDGGNMQNISYYLSELQENTHYFFRVVLVNDYGTYMGETKLFYTGNPIPNWDFEIWDNITKDFPNNWGISGGFEKIQYSDFTAIRLFTDSSEDKSSSLINGKIEGENMAPWHIPVESIIGGLQINERPDSIYINLKYNIDDNDTAVFFVGLIKDNFYVAENYFFIIGNQPDFHLNRYKINYLTSDIPDKAIIFLTNSNPFMDTVTNSVVEVSEIYFSNHSPEIPNYNFTDWHTSTFYQPFSWQNIIGNHQFDNFGNPDNFCEPSLDAYHNQYSIKLINNVNTNNHPKPGRISLTNWNDGIPINKRFYNFNGAYKFFKAAQDTATIHLILYSDDIQVGFTEIKITETIDEWTFFSVPISYNDPFVIPNKMNVIISASQWPPTGNSILYVDKLTLDGDFIPVNEFNIVNNTVFPIPAIDMLYFNFTAENVQIFNIFGKIVKSFIGTCKQIDISDLNPGIYILRDKNNVQIKFIKI